jgi:Na+/proline symporter
VNIYLIIVGVFLSVNLITGLYYGRGIRTIKEYAIGDRNFSTATIAATIIATWISGSFFTVSVSQTYQEGVWFIPAAMGDVISLLIIGHIFAPRMKEFLGSLSVAESMGSLYGKQVRLITAICSIAQAVAMTALQIKVFSSVFSHFFDFPSHYATCISSFVVIFYSAFGGIKAVTFTDVIQFFTFGIFIPLFALFIWQAFGNSESIVSTFQTDPLFDFTQLLNYKDPKFWPSLVMMFWFLIPSLSSPTFQRTLMARNTGQISQSFNVAAIGYFFIIMFICMIGLLVLAHDSTLDPNNIVVYIVDNYSFPGLKGFALIGIMAMVMSTADSWINTGAVIFAHDLCSPLGLKFKNELYLSRIFSIVVGIISTLLVLSSSNLFKLFSLQANFYMPIVTVPLMLAILGFRSTALAVKIGMFTGVMSTIIWKINITPTTGVDSVVPAMAMNLIAFICSHYLLRQPGGWISRNEDLELKEIRRKKKVETGL